jgi:catechol 2,3-dioxygenase-like lactoylglutathione lyase family enzyme
MTASRPRLGAFGIGVSDLRASSDFYTSVFGLSFVSKFHLPDMDEIILSMDGRGAALVLMCHTDGVERDLANTGGKVVFYVTDPSATVDVARERGAVVVREATPVPEFGDAVIGFVKDPDGHLIEILQA